MRNHHTARGGILALFLLAFTLLHAQIVTITPNVTGVCHSTDGAVTFTTSGGSGAPLNFALYGTVNRPAQTSPTFTGLSAGWYQVRVGGSASDSGYANFSIGTLVNVDVNVTNTTCPLNQGSIDALPTGGAGPYSYEWSNFATTQTISGLAGGNYRVTVTDANTCSASLDTAVHAISSLAATITQTGTVCTPVLTASVANGTGTVNYSWNTGSANPSITSLAPYQYYTVTATDAAGCTAAAVYATGSNSLEVDSSGGNTVTIVYPGCNAPTGSITLHIRDGQSPYSYHWTGSASTDSIASGLAIGYYTVTVTDANGCTGSNSYYLYNSGQVQTYICSYIDPTCGASDGSLRACSYGGSGVYTYQWSNSAATGDVQLSLPAGPYTVTATDANGCSSSSTYSLTGRANYRVDVTTTPTACDTSLYTGSATAIVSGSGGTPPYTFEWYSSYSYPSTLVGTGQTISNLSYQTYMNVRVIDAIGCGPNLHNDSVYIQKDPSCYDHITGYVFSDLNGNCTQDAGETGLSGVYVTATGNGVSQWGTPDSTGFYDIAVQPGTYVTTAHLSGYGACVSNLCTNNYTYIFTAIAQVSSGNNFGIDAGATTFDLGVHGGCTPSTPGTTKEYWVYYYNHGLASSPAATTLTFTHDPNITLVSSTIPYSSYNAATHVITWALGSQVSNPYAGWAGVRLTFDVPNTLTLGSYLTSVSEIQPVSGDCNPSDNIESMIDMVSGSHDPNDKSVSPAGDLTESDSVLTYTIRFQNTGNAPATRIVIKDTLSSHVDPGTVVPGASSHSYQFALSGNGILTFTFEPIYLPDSVHNVDSSNGYVKYTVHTRRNLPLGTQVKNTAYIYFDFNPAVVTNTTSSTRSDIQTGIRDVKGSANGMTAILAPNPVQGKSLVHISGAQGDISFELTDVTGQKIMETRTGSRDISLDGEMFAPGLYLYTVRDAAGRTLSGKALIAH